MSDVLDIIHKLTFQVDNSQLQSVLSTLKQNTSEVGILQASIAKLENQLKSLSKTDQADIQLRKQIIAQIEVQKQKIDQLTGSIAKYATENEAALRKELGIINVLMLKQQEILIARNKANSIEEIIKYNQQLQITADELAKISGLQDKPIDYGNVKEGLIGASQRRMSALQDQLPFANTEDEIKDINRELTILQANLTRLQSLGQKQGLNAFNGDLKNVKSSSTTASLALMNLGRIVQDAPFGFLGIANNLNPALESFQRLQAESKATGTSLKDNLLGALTGGAGIGIALSVVSSLLIVFGDKLFASGETAEETAKKVDGLTQSLLKQVDVYNKYNRTVQDVVDEGEAKLQADIAAAKARGVVNGEQFAAQKSVFDQEQALRDKELKNLQEDSKAYTQITDFIARSSITSYQQIQDAINNPPGDIPTSLLNSLADAAQKAKDEDVKVSDFLGRTAQELADKRTEIDINAKKKQAERDAAEVEFKAKLAENEYSKTVALSERIRELQQQQNSLRLDSFTETSQKIQAQIELERDGLLKTLDKEIEDTRKAGILTATVQAQYSRIRQLIVDNANLDLGNKNAEYLRKLVQQEQDYVLSIRKIGLSNRQDRLKILQETEQDTLFQRIRIVKESTAIELAENSKAYDAAVGEKERELKQLDLLAEQGDDDARLRAFTLRKELNDIARAYTDKEVQITENGLRATVKAFEDAYKDRLDLITKYGTYERTAIQDTANDVIDYYLNQYEQDQLSYRKYQREKRRIQYDSDTATLQQQLKTYNEELRLAEEQEKNLANKLGVTPADKANASNRTAGARANVSKTRNALASRANTPSRAEESIFGEAAFITDLEDRRRTEINKSIEAYKTLEDAAIATFNAINDAQIKALDREIAIREKRVDYALTLAERGNTDLLNIEQKRLEDAAKQREQAARKEAGVNAALTLSNSILAIAQAAGETGAGAIVIVPAVIAALAAGFAAVSALSQENSFAEGVVGLQGPGTDKSDSIPARLSKGESVITAAATRRYGPMLEAMNAGRPVPYTATLKTNEGFATRRELAELGEKMDTMTEAVRDSKFSQDIRFDERGIAITTKRAIRRDRNRFL